MSWNQNILVKNPTQFYQQNIEIHSQTLQEIKKRLTVSSLLRLAVFISACFGIYFAIGNTQLVIGIIAVTILLFVFLVTRHSKLQYQRDLAQSLIAQNQLELRVLDRKFHDLPTGEEYANPLHQYSQDIDLFGRGSFYQYMNRTAIESGSDTLAGLLTENSIENILRKQKAIHELAQLPEWRQRYSAIASLVKTEISGDEVSDWLSRYQNFVPKWVKPVSQLFSMVSVGLILANYFGLLSVYYTAGWIVIGLLINGRFRKKIGALSEEASRVQSTFEQYYKLLMEIENQEFSSEMLAAKRATVLGSNVKSSIVLKKFARSLDVLEQGNIMIFGELLNGLALRNLSQCYAIEKWIETHKASVPAWFNTITFFDAYNSLGNFVFNHPDYVFPELTNNKEVLKVKGAGHPLLKEETMIRNDFQIDGEEFFIVTGANMAGKSTFLRTVSLQIVMGNIGLPVCAEKSEYRPIKLITSMRTTDSLTDDESYFFSELKRLKFIVDEIKKDRYFIILDEILKGTNSTDKAIGSRKFVEKLVSSKSTGIIATHDLSLCKVADEFSQVKNYFFDAQIENDELYFDYTLKQGICENMNASFLLKKMEIVD